MALRFRGRAGGSARACAARRPDDSFRADRVVRPPDGAVQLADTPQGPIRLDAYGNPIVNVYIRRVERRDGRLMNVVIDTYRDVSQFWKYDPATFLAAPVYSRDYPPAKNIE